MKPSLHPVTHTPHHPNKVCCFVMSRLVYILYKPHSMILKLTRSETSPFCTWDIWDPAGHRPWTCDGWPPPACALFPPRHTGCHTARMTMTWNTIMHQALPNTRTHPLGLPNFPRRQTSNLTRKVELKEKLWGSAAALRKTADFILWTVLIWESEHGLGTHRK